MNSNKAGLRVRYDREVQTEVRNHCIQFINWIRKRMSFPIRLTIYIKSDYLVKTKISKELVPAVFWAPNSLENEPHIRVATGDYIESLEKYGYYNTIAYIFDSIAHELIHYKQWLLNPTFKNGEREANKKAKEIVSEYLDYLDELYDTKVEELSNIINAYSLSKLLNLFEKCNFYTGEKIVNSLSNFTEFNEAKKFLIEQIGNSDGGIRAAALMSLSNFKKDEITNEVCLKCLYDDDEYVRIRAAEAACDLCDVEVIPHLAKMLEDKNQLIRGYSAISLGSLGNSETISILEEVLKKEKRNAAKLRIYVGLYKLGKAEYFNVIVKYLKNKSLNVRLAASWYLSDLSDRNNTCICIEQIKLAILKEKCEDVRNSMIKDLNYLEKYKEDLKFKV